MAVFKCKMCGGSLDVQENMTVIECDFCGTKQTLPNTNDEALQTLFNRANTLRMKSEFDKAAELYEKIVEQDDTQAEAHWGIVLCKYGIEYVEDPKTRKRIPTCHRASFEAVTKDIDYQAAIKHADTHQKYIYEAEAKAIDAIQRDILKIVNEEEPFDVFICYKETDSNGKRTVDSTIANDIYYQLTEQGYKVFYAAITLEDKLGQEYEPYIFAALNSAKVMLSIGTKPEYFQAVWVKNEWSRFLKIMKNDRSRMLIPCYRDMDAYELPEEFAHLQAQDMSKIGFISDLLRGIGKIIKKDEPKTVVKETIVQQNVEAPKQDIATILKRAYMFLEDGEWRNANDYAEKVLDIDPENAQAYLCKMLIDLGVKKKEQLVEQLKTLEQSSNFSKVLRYGDEALIKTLQEYNTEIVYRNARTAMNNAKKTEEFIAAARLFLDKKIVDYKDSRELNKKCLEKANNIHNVNIYQNALQHMRAKEYGMAMSQFYSIIEYKDSRQKYEECDEMKKRTAYDEAMQKSKYDVDAAIRIFNTIRGYKDVDKRIAECEAKRIQLLKEREERQKKEKIRKIVIKISIVIVALIVAAVILFFAVINPAMKKSAIKKAFIEKYSQEIYDRYGVVEEGRTITFGKYEYDDHDINSFDDLGPKPIEWIVLEVEEDRAMLFSKHVLDKRRYDSRSKIWSESELREWLNGEFLETAFTTEELEYILTVTVPASETKGESTEDKIYLITDEKLEKHFTAEERESESLSYFIFGDARFSNSGHVKCVEGGGYESINPFSTSGIRPVIWISLK